MYTNNNERAKGFQKKNLKESREANAKTNTKEIKG